MKKRHKAVFPILCLAVIVFGTVFIYLSPRDLGLKNGRAATHACDQARNAAAPDFGPNKPGTEPVLEDCERKGK